MIKNVFCSSCKVHFIGRHVKYPLFLSDFNESWIFWKGFRKILEYKISWKSVKWEPSCSIRDGRTDRDMMKSIIAFRNLASAPKELWYIMDIDSSHCTAVCFVELVWESRGSSVTIVTSTRQGQPKYRLRTPTGTKDFFFSEAFRPAVVPLQPPTQWVLLVALPLGRESDHSP
jgi:hypothetical protein